MKALLIFLTLALSSFAVAASSWYDKSHSIFLPRSSLNQFVEVQELPIFWWNFLVFELPSERMAPAETEKLLNDLSQACASFMTSEGAHVKKIACVFAPEKYESVLKDWIQDYPLRHSMPEPTEFVTRMNQGLVRATLPVGATMVSLLREDPVGALNEVQDLLKNRMQIKFQNSGQASHEFGNGFFYDPQTHRLLVPIQFNFSPEDTSRTRQLMDHVPEIWQAIPVSKPIFLLGPHASTLENEGRIRSDLNLVSWFGTALVLIFVVFAYVTKRRQLLLLLPPLGLAVVISVVLTVCVFGSIHGLTLSFGPGIVGLAMHYGLQAAFNFGSHRRIWRANFFGVLTTLAILVVVMFSQLPLLRQIMFFSSVGLTLAFIFFYLLQLRWPNVFRVEPLQIPLISSRVLSVVALSLAALSFTAGFVIRPDFNIRQMNFESERTHELGRWLYSEGGLKSPLLSIHKARAEADGESLTIISEQESIWAKENGIALQNMSLFLPSTTKQLLFLETWKKDFCPERKIKFELGLENFFNPFFQLITCGSLHAKSLAMGEPIPSYLEDFHAGNSWVSLWMPTSEQEIKKIRTFEPQAVSLVELVSTFPKTLFQEAIWMLPLSFFISFILLIIYCRSVGVAVIALVPFFSSVGLYVLAVFLLGWHVTLISFIGLIKVFGFSLDYGIFVTDLLGQNDDEHARGVWTALNLNSLSTFLGFLPLIFCVHPVLRQLGETLVIGAIGNYIGAMWGITPFTSMIQKRLSLIKRKSAYS